MNLFCKMNRMFMAKKLFLIIAMLLFAAADMFPATINFYMTNSLGYADTNWIKIIPIAPYINSDGSVQTTGLPFRLYPNTNGFASTNLSAGNYLATNQFIVNTFAIPGSFGTSQGIVFTVPSSAGTYSFGLCAISGYNVFNPYGQALLTLYTNVTAVLGFTPFTPAQVTNAIAANADTNGAAQAVTNGFPWGGLYQPTNHTLTLLGGTGAFTNQIAAGVNITLTTNGQGVITWSASGGGGAGTNSVGSGNSLIVITTNGTVYTLYPTSQTNSVAFTNGGWWDISGLAQQATNGIGPASQLSAFQPTNFFDLAGSGATKANQATNAAGTATGLSAYQPTNFFDLAGTAKTIGTVVSNAVVAGYVNQTNGLSTNQTALNATVFATPVGNVALLNTNQVEVSSVTEIGFYYGLFYAYFQYNGSWWTNITAGSSAVLTNINNIFYLSGIGPPFTYTNNAGVVVGYYESTSDSSLAYQVQYGFGNVNNGIYTNLYISQSTFQGNGNPLTNLNAANLVGGPLTNALTGYPLTQITNPIIVASNSLQASIVSSNFTIGLANSNLTYSVGANDTNNTMTYSNTANQNLLTASNVLSIAGGGISAPTATNIVSSNSWGLYGSSTTSSNFLGSRNTSLYLAANGTAVARLDGNPGINAGNFMIDPNVPVGSGLNQGGDGGGSNNIGTTLDSSFIGGGGANQINTSGAHQGSDAILNGAYNVISNTDHSSILGGQHNLIYNCDSTMAAGNSAVALNSYVYVWSDGTPFTNSAANQVVQYAGNGFGFNTNNPGTNVARFNGNLDAKGFTLNGQPLISGLGFIAATNGTAYTFNLNSNLYFGANYIWESNTVSILGVENTGFGGDGTYTNIAANLWTNSGTGFAIQTNGSSANWQSNNVTWETSSQNGGSPISTTWNNTGPGPVASTMYTHIGLIQDSYGLYVRGKSQNPNLDYRFWALSNNIITNSFATMASTATNISQWVNVDILTNNYVRINGVITNIASSTTAGIQEVENLYPFVTNTNSPGSGIMFRFPPYVVTITNSISVSNNTAFIGSVAGASVLEYVGPTNTSYVLFSGTNLTTPYAIGGIAFNFKAVDMTFFAVSNFTGSLVQFRVNDCLIDNCIFGGPSLYNSQRNGNQLALGWSPKLTLGTNIVLASITSLGATKIQNSKFIDGAVGLELNQQNDDSSFICENDYFCSISANGVSHGYPVGNPYNSGAAIIIEYCRNNVVLKTLSFGGNWACVYDNSGAAGQLWPSGVRCSDFFCDQNTSDIILNTNVGAYVIYDGSPQPGGEHQGAWNSYDLFIECFNTNSGVADANDPSIGGSIEHLNDSRGIIVNDGVPAYILSINSQPVMAVKTNGIVLPAATKFTGNGGGLTGLTGLVFTNSAAGFLRSGMPTNTGAAGFLTMNICITNSTTVALSNHTSGEVIYFGGPTLLASNYYSATMCCNAGDSVVLTNTSGNSDAISGSMFHVLH